MLLVLQVPLAASAALLVAAVAASAQGQPAPPLLLPPVVVESSTLLPERTRTEEQAREEIDRTPGGVEIVPQQAVQESRGANLKDVLDFVPGVLIRPRFGAADESQFSIRGSSLRNNFHQRGVNILIDGFPYGNADGFSDFESLELQTTKYLEVYKGANALRFGGNTLGGAVNLVTKTGRDAGLVESFVEGGSYGFFKGYVGTGQVYGPLDLYASFSDTALQGYRDHSQQTRYRAYGSAGYQFSNGATLRFDLGFVHNDEQLPGALTPEQFRQNPQQQQPATRFAKEARRYDYTRGAVTFRTPLGPDQAVEWATQLNYQDLDHPLAFAVIDQTTYSYSTELRYLLAAPLLGRANRFTAGFQFFGTNQTDAQFQNVNGDRGAQTKNQVNITNTFGIYAEDQHDVVPAVTLVAVSEWKTGTSLTEATVSTKARWTLWAPSLTETVMVALPCAFAIGVTFSVRDPPLPPRSRPSASTSDVLDEAALMLRLDVGVSGSVTVKGTVTEASSWIATSSMAEIVGRASTVSGRVPVVVPATPKSLAAKSTSV